MAYDAGRQETVLFGGEYQYVRLGDTWIWDGQNWTSRDPTVSPAARKGHAMVFDAARQRVVMFGGSFYGSASNETWTWPEGGSSQTSGITVVNNIESAAFSISGTAILTGVGKTAAFSNVASGSYTINYAEASGYTKPANETKTLRAGETLYFSGVYQPIVTAAGRSALRVVAGQLVGQALTERNRSILVAPGGAINGNIDFGVRSAFGAGISVRMGVTPSWGPAATSFVDGGAVAAAAGEQRRVVTLSNFVAPTVPGTYYIVAAFREGTTPAEVMSASTLAGGGPYWGDGDDVAAWGKALRDDAVRMGAVLAPVRTGAGTAREMQWFAAAVVEVVVAAQPQLTVAPESLRFDYQQGSTDAVTEQRIAVRSVPTGLVFALAAESVGNWLTVSADSNKAPATIDVTVAKNQSVGDFPGTVVVTVAGRLPIRIPVTLSVKAFPVVPRIEPSAPRYLYVNVAMSEQRGKIDRTLPTIVLTHGLSARDDGFETLWTGSGVKQAGGMLGSVLAGRANVIQYVWHDAMQVGSVPNRSAYTAARSYREDAAQSLSKGLINVLGIDYSRPIHFVGHSLGSIVSILAARDFLLRATGVTNAQVTILDRPDKITLMPLLPEPCFIGILWYAACFRTTKGLGSDYAKQHLAELRNGLSLRVDNYYSPLAIGVGDVNEGSKTEFYNHPALIEPNDVGNLFFGDEANSTLNIQNNHSGVQQWYRWTIAQNESLWSSVCSGDQFPLGFLGSLLVDKSLSPCKKGWEWSVLRGDTSTWATRFPKNSASSAKIPERQALSAPRAIALATGAATEFGCPVSPGPTVNCKEAGSPYSVIPITLPDNAAYLSFRYRFASIGDGDVALVSIDGVPIWTVSAANSNPGELAQSSLLPLQGFGPGLHRMTVALIGAGVANVEIDVQDFAVTVIPPVTPVFGLSESAVTVAAGAGSGQVVLSGSPSNAPWTTVATSVGNWLTVSPGEDTGSGVLTYTFLGNPTGISRIGTIVAGGQTLRVTQAGALVPSLDGTIQLAGSGTSAPIQVRITQPGGVAQIGVVNILVNRALDGRAACYIAYSQPAQVLFLVNDAGPDAGLSPALTLGGAGSVSNSQCSVAGTGSSATVTGNTLVITLNISFTTSFGGNKVIYAAARNTDGVTAGWRTMGVHAVPPGTTSFPRSVSMSPSTGTTSANTVTFAFEDQTSTANLQTVWALMNSALDGRQACYVAFYAPANLLLLIPDDGDGSRATSAVLGSTAVLENSQCRINAASSTVMRSAGRLTLGLNVTYKPGLSGPRVIWMAASTLAGRVSEWAASGAWEVPP
ncbi:MAG: hypothetical protein NTV52_00465 [Acidobacteria bacterium]|nr:hypothetical protein [Acidobacteriota bacterium]